MDDQRLGTLVRTVRVRRGMPQAELACRCGVAQTTISLVERGHLARLSIETLRAIGAPLDIRIDVLGRWRGGDADRLLSRRHSELAQSVALAVSAVPGWAVIPEVSFSIFGERGVVDQLSWHADARHLLVVELKTEFVDVNDMLGVLDRKARLARSIAHDRGMDPRLVSVWLIVSDTPTNRRHARQHSALLGARFRLDGRSFVRLLRNPAEETTGLAFWSDSNRSAERSNQTPQMAQRRSDSNAG